MEHTQRKNLNRAYMKLEVWQRGMDPFRMAWQLAEQVRDFKLRSQFVDAAQSVSANIAEGYGRRTVAEYVYFLYAAKGSLAEALTRACGLRQVELLTDGQFENFDQLQYEVENKLLALIRSLEAKRAAGDWIDSLPRRPTPRPSPPSAMQPPAGEPLDPSAHPSNYPPIH